MTYMLPMPTATIAKKKTLLMALNEKAGQVNMKTRKIPHSMLHKERATRMEGSFGTEKEHYGLKKDKSDDSTK